MISKKKMSLLFGGDNVPYPAQYPGTLFTVIPHFGETLESNGYVSTWRDQSGHNNHLTGVSSQGAINAFGSAPVAELSGTGYLTALTDLTLPYTVYILWSNLLQFEFTAANKYFYRSASGSVISLSTSTAKAVRADFTGPAELTEEWVVVRIIANGSYPNSKIGLYDGTTLTESSGVNVEEVVSEALHILSMSAPSSGILGRVGWVQVVDAAPVDSDNDPILEGIAARISLLPDYSARVNIEGIVSTYSAFGNVVRDGTDLVAVWRRAASHYSSTPGDLYIADATAPGTSWNAPALLYTDPDVPSLDSSDPRIMRIKSGTYADRWVVSFSLYTAVNTCEPYVIYSDDDRSTWSVRKHVTHGFDAGDAVVSAPAVPLPNGDLILPLYSYGESVRYSRSTDGGDTWADEGVQLDPPGGLGFSEPNFGALDDGTYMTLIRSSSDFTIYRSIATYSAGVLSHGTPAEVLNSSGSPEWIQHTDGRIILVSRSYDWYLRTNEVPLAVFVSSDRGATWEAASYPYPTHWNMMYGSAVELADESMGIMYCQEFTTGCAVWYGPLLL